MPRGQSRSSCAIRVVRLFPAYSRSLIAEKAEGNNVAIRVRVGVEANAKRSDARRSLHDPWSRLPQLSTFCDRDCDSNATTPTRRHCRPALQPTSSSPHPPGLTPTPTTATANHSSVIRQSHTPASAHHNGRQLPPRWRRRRRW
jgi:hypothetical protein